MYYDYDKLKQPRILDVIYTHFKTRELDVMIGSNLDTIRLGNGTMFIVESGELRYYGGLSNSTTKDIADLAAVMSTLQTAITLECPIIEQ